MDDNNDDDDDDDDDDNDDDGGRTWGPVRGLQVLDGCCQSIINGSMASVNCPNNDNNNNRGGAPAGPRWMLSINRQWIDGVSPLSQ